MRKRLATMIVVLVAATTPPGATAQDRTQCVGDSLPSLGIDRLVCVGGSCAINVETPDGVEHQFSTEPLVDAVTPPARGVLERGDVVVAIDDLPITARDGGRRLANPIGNRPATLTIRRDTEELSVEILPEPGCRTRQLDVRRKGRP